jgi:aromatic ring-cleaving dioxygenase
MMENNPLDVGEIEEFLASIQFDPDQNEIGTLIRTAERLVVEVKRLQEKETPKKG